MPDVMQSDAGESRGLAVLVEERVIVSGCRGLPFGHTKTSCRGWPGQDPLIGYERMLARRSPVPSKDQPVRQLPRQE